MNRESRLLLSALVCAAFVACSDKTQVSVDAAIDTGSDPIDAGDVIVDAVDAMVDSDPSDGTPDAMQPALTRVLFVIDASQSINMVDPVNADAANPLHATNRSRAIAELIDQYIDLDPASGPSPAGDAAFAIMIFNTSKQILTTVGFKPAFIDNPIAIKTALPGVNVSNGLTDYEGALVEARNLLSADIAAQIKAAPAAVERMRYTVVFLSDGSPDPQITDAGDWDSLPPGLIKELIGSQDPSTVPQYNVRPRILAQVKALVDLGDQHGLEKVFLHTAYLAQNSPGSDVAKELLKDMAQESNSIFLAFSDAEQLDFTDFKY